MAQLLDRANIKGEDCILKSMCEIHDVVKPKLGIAEEILRILFSIPKDEQDSSEEDYTNEDDNLNTRTIEQTTEEEGVQDCNERYPECPVSLLQMLLGLQVESIELKR
uniref:Uncharacterized protein n=1 Tax=Cacopsylla melanoneura TaxID=428564 RepID=A0A8D8QXG1_9HEMI